MINIFFEMFGFTFLVRAFVVGILVSLCASLLGVSLVMKRFSMIGDGLSHVGFGSLAIATAMNAAPLIVSIPIVIFAAFLLLRMSENSRIKGDAAIALISTSSLAIGVIVISLTTGMNTDVCNYLFGSILAMSKNDVYLSVVLSIMVLVLFFIFYHKLFAITFDETFAKIGGVKTGVYNMLIAFLTALTIVLGMRIMGAMLISSLIIFPALSSMRLFKKFRSVTISSALVSVFCFFTGIVISYIYATPTGASVVLINIIVFILFWCIECLRNTKGWRLMQKIKLIGKSPSVVKTIVLIIILFSTISCTKTDNKNVIIEIKEKIFISQVNDVYLNTDDYLGKTIKLEGLFMMEYSDTRTEPYCFVLRYGPGCCGSDGNVGFEVAYMGNRRISYPEENSWVEAIGELKTYKEENYQYLYLDLFSLNVLNIRGAEYVNQ